MLAFLPSTFLLLPLRSRPAVSRVSGLLLPLRYHRTILAVFGVVGGRLKRPVADSAPFRGGIAKNLRL